MSVDEAEEKVRASLKLGGYLLSVVTAHCTFTYFFSKAHRNRFSLSPLQDLFAVLYSRMCISGASRLRPHTRSLERYFSKKKVNIINTLLIIRRCAEG